ncbi:hypothetical protein GSI_09776 [Ganoderma sinense ZZ0214-1]|uniref:Fungal-type protein kinase domain-containing protein n=1 Tax=Ganoderma sinense ZZ0214-1 TaxID=1077348 RepID=A0A2G8S2X7_9APHY|nr:hypothetical protein GSI_09776 [Ganoderma sinense ZZ0214-1]
MTLSTNDISSVCFCPCSSEDIRQESTLEGWRKELHRRIIPSEDSRVDFLHKYVPSRTPCPPPGDVTDAFAKFAQWVPQEENSHQLLIEGLAALVSSFPADKRPSFLDCLKYAQRFPFSTFENKHRSVYLDIAVSFPGQAFAEDEYPNWFSFSSVMKSKPEGKEDPFKKRRHKPCKALIQLAVLTHNLMHAHGLTCAFIFGIYGDTIRICRFDHSGAVVCQPLSLKNVADLKILQQFFWNFVHPTEEGPFVGWDPTVRRLNADEEEWLLARLERANVDTQQLILSEARFVQVFDGEPESDGGREPQTYITFNLLDASTRLFSRATTVWRAIRDTRRRVDGRLVDPPSFADDLKVRIIKEAWRPLLRRSEKDFYDRLDSAIPPHQRVGLPSLVCGSDMGEREVRLWESALYGAFEPIAPDGAHHKSRLSAPASQKPLSSAPLPPSLSGPGGQSDLPIHRPLQQTFTWRQARGAKYWYRERSHVRLVVGEVGRPVTRFRSTKELVRAFPRDAIIGHRNAMAKGGILHRDISVGNILIVDDPALQDQFCGFIHDFDYSSMTGEVPQNDILSLPAEAVDELLLADDIYGFLIQRTGTWNYMATELIPACSVRVVHAIRHDLESFYWTLLWVVLRHTSTRQTVTSRKPKTRQQVCADVFTKDSPQLAAGSKLIWLGYSAKNLEIARNRPLTALMKAFALLVNDGPGVPGMNLDYDNVLGLFDAALAAESWPEVGDGPLEYVSESSEELSSDRPHRHRRKRARARASKRKGKGRKTTADPEWSSSVLDGDSDDEEPWESDDDDAPRLAINGADDEDCDEDDQDCDKDDEVHCDQDSVDFGCEFPPTAALSYSDRED